MKLRRKLDNLNEGYKFMNSIGLGEDSIFPTYKEKASSLSDIMLQIQNVGNQLQLNEHEIQHFNNLNDEFNDKIWNFKLEINYILINNNSELKNYIRGLFENYFPSLWDFLESNQLTQITINENYAIKNLIIFSSPFPVTSNGLFCFLRWRKQKSQTRPAESDQYATGILNLTFKSFSR